MWHFKLKCDIALNENSQMSLTDSLVIFELRGKLFLCIQGTRSL